MASNLIANFSHVRHYYEKGKRLLAYRERKALSNFYRLRARFYESFWEDAARNIGAEIEHLGYEYLRIRKAGQWTFVNLSDVMLDDHLSLRMAGNKPFIHRLLGEYGYRVPCHLEYDLLSIRRAYEFLLHLGRNAVVKPASGTGGGCGVTAKIHSYRQLRKASFWAAAFDYKLLIEEEVQGNSYRLLYLDGQFVDAVRRDPPTVTGNGKSTIRGLILNENAKRLNSSLITALSPITIDLECKLKLKEQGLSLRYVPSNGEDIVVKAVVNQNSSQENHVVRDQVHPSIVKLGSDIVSIFNLKLVGLDIIALDINLPLEESGGLIGEINTTPGLHHHALVSEKSKKAPVAELILEYIFSRQCGQRTFSFAMRRVR